MAKKYTPEELNDLSRQELILLVTSMQENLEQLNANMEKLIEQISIANQQRFGRHSERLDVIDGQMNLFNEAEALSEETGNDLEPSIDEVLPQKPKKKKKAGTRDADLSGLPEESIIHSVPEEKLIEHFGEGCYRKLPDESYKRLRYTPASWTVENHTVEVYVGTDGLRQDEFLRGDRPVVLYEYQKTRHHRHPEEFYKGFKGILVTDGLAQYHLLEDHLEGLTNANCYA